MDVGIDEPGGHKFALQVHNLCVGTNCRNLSSLKENSPVSKFYAQKTANAILGTNMALHAPTCTSEALPRPKMRPLATAIDCAQGRLTLPVQIVAFTNRVSAISTPGAQPYDGGCTIQTFILH